MANWSRALLSLGDGLGQLAQSVGQRQRDEMMMAREENLVRLRAKLDEEGNVTKFGRQKELIGMEEAARGRGADREEAFALKRDAQGQTFETTQAGERRKHELTMAGREEGLHKERWKREDLQQFERSYVAQVDDIDDRLSKINDEITKQRASASTDGTVLDENVLGPWQKEITQLQGQKRLLAKQRASTLASMGAPGYEKITEEEANRLNASSGPTARNTGKGERRAAAAAQAPAQKQEGGAPPPPSKPQGMIDRENRKSRKVAAPGGATLGPVGRHFRDLDTDTSAPMGRGGPIPERLKSAAVKSAKQTLQSGRPISAEQRQELQRIGRERLKGVYGFTDDDLERARVHR